MTLAVGVQPHTFADAPFNLVDKVGDFLNLIPTSFLLGLLAEVIAQYEPPKGVSAMLAANIVGKPKKGMAASIVDLAVRGKLRIIENSSVTCKDSRRREHQRAP